MRVLFLVLLLPLCAQASDFAPDPLSVQRYGPAYRYPQHGWIVLHVEGKPYERGYQHGRLLGSEIAGYVRCFAALMDAKSPANGWRHARQTTNALFLRRFDKEYLEEMQGIADGAADAGAKFDGRSIDLTDVTAVNCWAELETLDNALDAIPTGFEGIKFPRQKAKAMPVPKPEHCSAFAATGPATADGKIVFGHITMFSLYAARSYNVWLDVQPTDGHRVLMQTYPGGIQSGMDYYLNDVGLMVCETTIAQTRFNGDGTPLTSRIRKALQYGDSIDAVVKTLTEGNNGLYTNEWLIGDTKTNEIAMFELGTKATKLWRSSKNEWFGGTEGFYWGCNNTKDLNVRLETIPAVKARPESLVWRPSNRDKKWLQFYAKHQGKITADTGKEAFTTPPLCAAHSLDAKITTTDLAKNLKTLAIFGPPIGGTWQPSDSEKSAYPEIVPLVPNDWTTLHTLPPATGAMVKIADMPKKVEGFKSFGERQPGESIATTAAWHGTLHPQSDDDVWITASFAAYERIVALEHALRDGHDDGDLTAEDKEHLALEMNAHRSHWLLGKDVKPAKNSGGDMTRDVWLQAQTGRGVLVLAAVRKEVGGSKFDGLLDEFGLANAGTGVTAEAFRAFFVKKAGKPSAAFDPKAEVPDAAGPAFTITSWRAEEENAVSRLACLSPSVP